MNYRQSGLVATLSTLLSVSGIVTTFWEKAHGQVPHGFYWGTQSSNAELWNTARQVLINELVPDNPKMASPYEAMKYKYISRIGVFESAVLVIIGERKTASDTTGDFFVAYSVDTGKRTKTKIDDGSYLWEFVRLARFEPTPTPDVVFKSLTCTECETTRLLSSYYYDAPRKSWALRRWAQSDWKDLANGLGLIAIRGVTIDAGIDPGNGEVAFNCIWSVKDFTKDGFDDVADMCRSVFKNEKGILTTKTGTLFYSFAGGNFHGGAVKTAAQEEQIKSELCTGNQSSELCKQNSMPSGGSGSASNDAHMKNSMPSGDSSLPRRVMKVSPDIRQATTGEGGGGLPAPAQGHTPAIGSFPALDQARGQVHELERQLAAKRASTPSIPPKDMFETTADYEKRKQAAEIQRETQLLLLIGQIDAIKRAIYPDANVKPVFVMYDADAKLLTAEVASERFSFPVDNAEARRMHDAWADVTVGFPYTEAVAQSACPVLLWQGKTHSPTTGFGACSGNGSSGSAGDGANSLPDGLYRVGGNISMPSTLFAPEAEFSDQARRDKYQGVCVVGLIVDAQGNPQNVNIVRGLGRGLDEKAIEAVERYKFRPAMKDGTTPVPVYVNVEVNFRLY